ncbi:hypothetical protein D3C72_1732290 [compost metagenome]
MPIENRNSTEYRLVFSTVMPRPHRNLLSTAAGMPSLPMLPSIDSPGVNRVTLIGSIST